MITKDDLVAWENKKFDEIPEQDNPAHNESGQECVMVCIKERFGEQTRRGTHRYCSEIDKSFNQYSVLHINGDKGKDDCFKYDRVKHIAITWSMSNAILFGEAYINLLRKGELK